MSEMFSHLGQHKSVHRHNRKYFVLVFRICNMPGVMSLLALANHYCSSGCYKLGCKRKKFVVVLVVVVVN